MVMNVAKNLSEDEKNKLVEFRKKYYTMKKALYHNYNKVFKFRKFCFFIRKSIRNLFPLRLCLKTNIIFFDFQVLQVPF